jgi:phosphatidate cytidylyltransferase
LKERDAANRAFGVGVGVLAVPLFYMGGPGVVPPYLIGVVLLLFVNRFFYEREFPGALRWAGARLAGVVYIAVPLSYLIVLRRTDLGAWWILFLFTVIWLNDTFAFCVGRLAGRRKLCPWISPMKTVEGAAGGLAGGVVGALVFTRYVNLGAGTVEVIVLALVTGLLCILGDLVESVIKRGAGVKDTGALIPGHGGVLDRIDSMLFAVPFMYYYIVWLEGRLL